jgi:hypothetical protein
MSWGSNGGFKFTAGLDFDTKEHEVRPAIQLECQVCSSLRLLSPSPQHSQHGVVGSGSQTVALLSPTLAVTTPGRAASSPYLTDADAASTQCPPCLVELPTLDPVS